MPRSLLLAAICVTVGLVSGVYVGAFVLDFEPTIVGWLFGAGAGISGGAFVAAIATNTPLAGSSTAPQRRGVIPRNDDPDDEDYAEPPSRNGHGTNGSAPRS